MAFYENAYLVEEVLRKVPIRDRLTTVEAFQEVFPTLESVERMRVETEAYYTFGGWNMRRMAMAIWPSVWMQKYGMTMLHQTGTFEWAMEKPMAFHTIPENLPAPSQVLTDLTVEVDGSVRLEVFVAPEASKMLHTLPMWFELYEKGGVGDYHFRIIQTFETGEEEGTVSLEMKMMAKVGSRVQLRVKLSVEMSEHPDTCSVPEFIMVGDQSWDVTYDHTTQSLLWETPELQFPPPPETAVRTYQPGATSCLFTDYANGVQVKHCNPPGCFLEDYRLVISTDDLSRLLLGK